MSLLCSLVARDGVVLCRYADCIGNFSEVGDAVVRKIDVSAHQKLSYKSGAHAYHYISDREEDLVFLCIADEDFDRAEAFTYLETIKSRFLIMYSGPNKPKMRQAQPLDLDQEFCPIMANEMKKCNNDTRPMEASRVDLLRQEVQQVKDIMISNIDSIVERGERLDLLVDKTENLSNQSVSFRQNTRRVQRKMWWQNMKVTLILTTIFLLIVAYAITAAACGGMSWPKCI